MQSLSGAGFFSKAWLGTELFAALQNSASAGSEFANGLSDMRVNAWEGACCVLGDSLSLCWGCAGQEPPPQKVELHTDVGLRITGLRLFCL